MEVIHAGQEVFRGADRGQTERGRAAPGPGSDHRAGCKRLGISDQTFFRWRIKYGALKEDEAQRRTLA
ncbi:MAG: transposase [Actinomycetota bacterium]